MVEKTLLTPPSLTKQQLEQQKADYAALHSTTVQYGYSKENKCTDPTTIDSTTAKAAAAWRVTYAPLLAGVCSGAAATLVGHPFETLKTRMQVGRLLPANTRLDTALLQQLYRGLLPPLLTTGALNSIHFTMFETFRRRIEPNVGDKEGGKYWLTTTLLSGSLSGSLISWISCPISVVKIQQQVASEQSLLACIREMYQHTGARGFYRGLLLAVPLDASRGVYLAMYEVLKVQIAMLYNELATGAAVEFIATATVFSSSGNSNSSSNRRRSKDADSSAVVVASAAAALSTTAVALNDVTSSSSIDSIDSITGGNYSNSYNINNSNNIINNSSNNNNHHHRHNNNNNNNNNNSNNNNSNINDIVLSPESAFIRVSAAGLSGICCWIIIYPLDVIKSRLQSDYRCLQYSSSSDCIKKTFNAGGLRAFYRGLLLNVIRAGPVSAATLSTYEFVKDLLMK